MSDYAKGGLIKRGSSKIPIIEINNASITDDNIFAGKAFLPKNINRFKFKEKSSKVITVSCNYKENEKEAIFPLKRVDIDGVSVLQVVLQEAHSND